MRAHGVRGMLRVRSTSPAWTALRHIWVGEREQEVVQVQPERGDWLVKLAGVDDRDAAEALRGAPVLAPREALPPAADDEVYVADLIGCRVVDSAGRELGEVAGSFDGGAYEVLEVRGARDFLLPFTDGVVTAVDVEARLIRCDPPPGLIDLDEAES
jgi:16S rRNA processing protein RimM